MENLEVSTVLQSHAKTKSQAQTCATRPVKCFLFLFFSFLINTPTIPHTLKRHLKFAFLPLALYGTLCLTAHVPSSSQSSILLSGCLIFFFMESPHVKQFGRSEGAINEAFLYRYCYYTGLQHGRVTDLTAPSSGARQCQGNLTHYRPMARKHWPQLSKLTTANKVRISHWNTGI